MQRDTEGTSFEVVEFLEETGTPAGLGDGRQWLGVKWVVCERILNGRSCGSDLDFEFWAQCWHGSVQG